MKIIENKYIYSVKVKSKCEYCDNDYTRVDNHINSDKQTKKDFDNFYDNIYDGVSDDEIDICPKCNSFMYPEEIIGIKEDLIKDYDKKYDLYINDKNKIIPTNDMELLGITLEGTNERNIKEAINLELNEENYKSLYNRGKDLWNQGYVSKYIILFIHKDKCFGNVRPDKSNFERYRNLSYYLDYNDKEFVLFPNGKSKKEILKTYSIENISKTIPTFERGEELEY